MLYVIRHGKTDWNAIYKTQGRTNIPLNEEGRKMAREAHELYKDINFDVCYCSPLIRARETADLLLEGRDIEIIEDDRLMEMSFGICEGSERVMEQEEHPLKNLFVNPTKYEAVEGGESFEELYARTGSFLKEIALPLVEEGKDVLIVGHGAMNLSIVSQVKNIPLENYWDTPIENCRLCRLI